MVPKTSSYAYSYAMYPYLKAIGEHGVIEAIKERFDITVTLDTYKGAVAEAGLLAGADMINDIWGLKYEKNPGKAAAKAGCGIILMHNRDNTDYSDFIGDVIMDLKESVDIAKGFGIPEDTRSGRWVR